jgi:RimJ/RimL family protein N-acetyltransferase
VARPRDRAARAGAAHDRAHRLSRRARPQRAQGTGRLEVGYRIFPEHRRRGYATEAVRALLDWARAQGIDRFIASVGPKNAPSLALVRQLGFREVGCHWDDEDGEELEFELSGADS